MVAVGKGWILIHSAPRALAPHVEWAAGRGLGSALSFDWEAQKMMPNTVRGEAAWQGSPGDGAAIASALRGWEHLRYEVVEEPSEGVDGARWMHTPDLGIFHAQTDSAGNIVVPEDRIRAAMAVGRQGSAFDLTHELSLALGQAWDDELEPFRQANGPNPVVWLHQVG